MVATRSVQPEPISAEILTLGDADAPEMLALARLSLFPRPRPRALSLYEALGFRVRAEVNVAVLERIGD